MRALTYAKSSPARALQIAPKGFVVPHSQDFKAKQHMEFVWQSSSMLPTEMFCHVLDTHYNFPVLTALGVANQVSVVRLACQMHLRIVCNLSASQAAELVQIATQRASWFTTNQLLVPLGNVCLCPYCRSV